MGFAQKQHIITDRKNPPFILFSIVSVILSFPCIAQIYGGADPNTYGFTIYRVDSGLYPYVQVYFRTFNQFQEPLINLNAMNIGLMVKGTAYDPAKRQYQINTIRQRQGATRSAYII
ncbi:MAG: hypothetical protein ACRERV_04700 [Methylococcales bacterium]